MILNSKHTFPHRSEKLTLFRVIGVCLAINSWMFIGSAKAQTMDNPAFAAAMSHIAIGEWLQAEGLLKFLLSQNPEMHRARLELGLVYLQMQSPDKAKAQFDILLASPEVPDNVKQNIRQRVSPSLSPEPEDSSQTSSVALNNQDQAGLATEAHKVSGNIQISIGYDDNVRYSAADYFLEEDPFLDGLFLELDDGKLVYVAPDGFVYDIDGNLLFANDSFFDLGNPDRENSFVEAKLSLNHEYQFHSEHGLTWHNKLALQTTENQQLSDYNKTQIRLQTGLDWNVSEQLKWSLVAHHRLLERDGQVQIRALAIEPEITYHNDWGSWTLGLEWMRRKYEDSIIVNGEIETFYYGFTSTIRSISGKWSKLFWDNDLLLLARLEYSDNNADDDFNYKGTRITLASVYDFHPGWSLLLSASDFKQDYSEIGNGPLDDVSTSLRGKLAYSLNDATELFLAGERALRTSDVYGGIKSDKSLIQVGVELGF